MFAFAGEHKDRLSADGISGLQVAQRIADTGHVGQIDIEAVRDVLQHARLGFAAVAAGFRTVRAIKDCIDAGAGMRQRQMHLVVNCAQRGNVEQTAPDARLVGCQHHVAASLIEARDGLQAAGNRYPFVRVLDELGTIVIDHAVAIENDELHAASFERSATLFIRL